MTVSRSIRISTDDPILFLWLSDIPLCVCVCVCVCVRAHARHIFVHPSDGHLAGFHVLAIVNGAAVNWAASVSLSYVFLWVYAQYWDCWVIW